jgi:hypothetical protein
MASEPLWMPTHYTRPLTDDFVSDGPALRDFVRIFWKDKSGKPFSLYPWQADLIDRVLERYPADWPVEELRGRLRYEQCVISMGRQNGKTILAAILSLYGLIMHVQGPTVLGLAESVQQANLVYDVARFVIDNDVRLSNKFVSTGTRGIRSLDGTRQYRVAPGKADALQGITISFCLYDEVHLTPPDMWAAVLYGMSAVQDGMVVGITTAGDNRSELLKQLYVSGAKAEAGEAGYERFGFFLWEAPEGAALDDPAAIMAANPSIACGAKDLEKTLNNVRTTQEHLVRQFVHNRFVASSAGWLPTYEWTQLPEGYLPVKPTHVAVAVSPSWGWATLTVSAKHEGRVYTEAVATVEAPDLDRLEAACLVLASKHRLTFVMEGNSLRSLAVRLRERGHQAEWFNSSQMCEAANSAYAVIKRRQLTHDHAAIVVDQIGKGAVKTAGDSWRIVPVGKQEIDALLSTVMAIHAAETMKAAGVLIG